MKNKSDSKMSKPKPDDRSDNVEKIQYNINRTIQNYELAEEMIAKTGDEKTKEALKEKNERRLDSLDGMRKEIRDEALDRDKRQGREPGQDRNEKRT